MHIILIGFKNSGKTTLGQELSRVLNKSFIDIDDLIIEKYKSIYNNEKPLAQIYKDLGETEFRKMESEIVQKLSLSGSSIIATGGGTILDYNNVAFLKNIGYLFFLDISYAKVLERIYKSNSFTESLFLGVKKSKQNIARIFKSRYKIYKRAADFIVNVDTADQQVVNEVIQLWQATV
jgi:shikimate kinase